MSNYELINTEGLHGVVSGDRTIVFATITPEQMEYLFQQKSRYVRLAQPVEEKVIPQPPEPPADRAITGKPSRKNK